MKTRTGLDVLIASNFAPLAGKRVGMVTHAAAVDRDLVPAVRRFLSATSFRTVALFGPEHGLFGQAQDLVAVAETTSLSGPRRVSLYGSSFASLKPTREQLRDIDILVVDMQDVGSRYYTFAATMYFCLEAAAEASLPVLILDRPNPLGGIAVEGPTIQPGFESFVGLHPVATRHGMTLGELAHLFVAERRLETELDVVRCEHWRREMTFDQSGLPWVMPSPNMPTLDTAFVYPGQCLIEGTNLSEGRGTTRPFEICGAPSIDADTLADRLNGEAIDGVRFRPAWFEPAFQKHRGRLCGGIQLHVTDRDSFLPVRAGVAVLAALRDLCPDFRWRSEVYEFVADRPAIDLLFGSERERRGIEQGVDWRRLAQSWVPEEDAFRNRRRPHLLY
jgi:uncharacterized protein YbbC (DUF1343 family)